MISKLIFWYSIINLKIDLLQLEDLEITLADQMRNSGIRGVDFAAAWEAAKSRGYIENEVTFEMDASVKSLSAAVESLTSFLGMEAVERSDRVQPNAVSHTLLMIGVFRGGKEVLAQARLAVMKMSQVMMNLTLRAQDDNIAELIFSSVGES